MQKSIKIVMHSITKKSEYWYGPHSDESDTDNDLNEDISEYEKEKTEEKEFDDILEEGLEDTACLSL